MSNGHLKSKSQPPPGAESTRPRLLSLDALRGFDMFWIVGGDNLIHALRLALPVAPLRLIDGQMDHVDWNGLAFYDLIFPLFVFMIGISIVFSLTRTIEKVGKTAAIKRILLRSLILYSLGVLVYHGVADGFDRIRWVGVLQRLAICYCFASLIFCWFRLRAMIALVVVILLGYWGIMATIPIRDINLETEHLKALYAQTGTTNTMALFLSATNTVKGRFDDGLTVAQHFDFQYLPGRKWDGAYDPEGILSTLPAIATCLLGVFAGLWLRSPSGNDQSKVRGLAVAGVCAIALGCLWGTQFPIIKKIWSSSYVLVAGGFSALFLALFYYLIEIKRWRKWCIPFVWIGMNSITIYMVFHIMKVEDLAKFLVGGPIKAGLGNYGELLLRLVVTGMMFAFVRFLYQRKIFLRL